MVESAVEPIWLVGLPYEWPSAPAWMSFSDLRNIETCPRRWSLSAASYPNIWSRRGYPPKIYLGTLYGHILYGALELIVKSLNRVSCPSVEDESFVDVMRGLGGYTGIIEQAAAHVLNRLNENPRFTPRSRYFVAELKKAAPALRENLQILVGKLRLGGMHFGVAVQQPRRVALNEGTYAEIELRVAKMQWHGFVDMLTVSESNCEIVDFKTGEPTPEHEEQVRVYSLLWARDSELNPKGRIANCLTVSYSRGDTTVKSLTDDELDLLERDLALRSINALTEIRKNPPPAVPSLDNCTFCSVRQLCDEYWTDATQELLAQEKSNASGCEVRHLADFEVEIGEQESPSIWRATALHCRLVSPLSAVLIRIPEENQPLRELTKRGRRFRIIDAFVTGQTDDESTTLLISLTRSSEAFVV